MILRLVYVSAAARPFDAPALAELLRASRARNAADGLTGMLLYHDGSFIQVLEGPEPAVRACYARIQRDRRHVRVTTVFEEEDGERAFAEWSMGFLDPAAVRPADLAAFTPFLEHRADADAGTGAVREALLVFRESVR